MAYEVQNFENGQTLTAEQINHMEDGILVNSGNMAYEKQNFENGQKLTAEQLNHIESGIYAISVNDSGNSEDIPVVEQATPEITVNSSGLITASATQEAGRVTAGTKTATKQLTVQTTQTIIPGTSDKTINSGIYLIGTQTIKGDGNLIQANIKAGVSIFGVMGSLEASSGGNTGGLAVRTGTITGTGEGITIDTGLSSISYFMIAKTSISATGVIQLIAKGTSAYYVYCSSYSQYLSTCVSAKSSNYIKLNGGTFQWTATGTMSFTVDAEYEWFAFGTE